MRLFTPVYNKAVRGMYTDEQLKTIDKNAHQMYVHLVLVTIMWADQLDTYLRQCIEGLKEARLLRFQVKRLAGTMVEQMRKIRLRCEGHDQEFVERGVVDIWPGWSVDFFNDGGSITARLQLAFPKAFGDYLMKIYLANKNALDYHKTPHSEAVARVMLVMQLSNSCIEFHETVNEEVHGYISSAAGAGFGFEGMLEGRRVDYGALRWDIRREPVFEPFRKAANDLVSMLTGDRHIPEDYVKMIRQLLFNFHRTLQNEDFIDMIGRQGKELREDYIRYVLARLCLRLREGRMRLGDLRKIRARLGSKADSRQLIHELYQIAVTLQTAGHDAIDLGQEIPYGDTDHFPMVHRFASLCFHTQMAADTSDTEHKALCRVIRRAIRQQGHALSFGQVAILYKELKTKKALLTTLRDVGELAADAYRTARSMPVVRYHRYLEGRFKDEHQAGAGFLAAGIPDPPDGSAQNVHNSHYVQLGKQWVAGVGVMMGLAPRPTTG